MIENGRPVSGVSQALGVGQNLIYRWRSRAKAKAAAHSPLPDLHSGSVSTADIVTLQKRIQQLEIERDILKKALAIFSRQI